MARTNARTIITVKIFIEEKEIAPVRVMVKCIGATIDWTTSVIIAQEDMR